MADEIIIRQCLVADIESVLEQLDKMRIDDPLNQISALIAILAGPRSMDVLVPLTAQGGK